MDQSWKRVFFSKNIIRVSIVKDALEQFGITAIQINKQDSSYNNFGDSEIYVNTNDVVRALNLIENEIIFD